jgi:hypothetical protein
MELRFERAPKLFGFALSGFAFNDSYIVKFTHDNLWK